MNCLFLLLVLVIVFVIWCRVSKDPIAETTLSGIENRIDILVESIDSRHPGNNITPRIRKCKLSEARVEKNYTSYTIDKRDVKLCLRTRDNEKKIYDMNLLMFVVLHELAHVCNHGHTGHGPEFLSLFRFLISEAVSCGIYTYVDYAKQPVLYCGLVINSNV